MSNNDDEYVKLIKNLFIVITIITLILITLPGLLYFYGNLLGKNKGIPNDSLIKIYKIDSEDVDNYNTLNEILLFCSYIPVRRINICDDKNSERLNIYNKHLSEVSDIIEILKKIYEKSISDAEKNKAASAEAQTRAKEKREAREHEEHMTNTKEAGVNSRFERENFRMWFVILTENLGGFVTKFGIVINTLTDKILQIINIVTPILKALASNRVFIGFLVLVFIISIIFGLLKPKDKAKENKKKDASSDDRFGFYSIYNEIMDTYNYYRNMINNFKISDMPGGVFKEEDKDSENDANGLVINRKKIDGKYYDNLSYVVLSDVFNKDEIVKYFGKDVNIEKDRYYNIYMPNERFKNDMPTIKWKVSDAEKNNEKVWRVDCEQIDKILKNGVDTNQPAFISYDNKCIINKRVLEEINNPQKEEENIHYTTEYIK